MSLQNLLGLMWSTTPIKVSLGTLLTAAVLLLAACGTTTHDDPIETSDPAADEETNDTMDSESPEPCAEDRDCEATYVCEDSLCEASDCSDTPEPICDEEGVLHVNACHARAQHSDFEYERSCTVRYGQQYGNRCGAIESGEEPEAVYPCDVNLTCEVDTDCPLGMYCGGGDCDSACSLEVIPTCDDEGYVHSNECEARRSRVPFDFVPLCAYGDVFGNRCAADRFAEHYPDEDLEDYEWSPVCSTRGRTFGNECGVYGAGAPDEEVACLGECNEDGSCP